MGGACSTPHIDTREPPLEVLVLSDGCSSDQALVDFLTQSGWLAASSILQRRLPPRQPHRLPPPITVSTQHSLHHKRSSRSDAAPPASVHPAPLYTTTAAATSSTLSPSPSNSPPSSSPSSASSPSSTHPTPPSPPPLLYFLCDTHPICVRFHTCPDYAAVTRRRASNLAKQARPYPAAHSRRPSASAHLGQPLHCTAPLDGAIVFLSTKDALGAGSVLIAGIRPMLKRRVKEGGGGGLGGGGLKVGGIGDKGRPAVGRVGAEGNMLPFVVVGVDGETEDEGRSGAGDEVVRQQKGSGRITVQPRHSGSTSAEANDLSSTAAPPHPPHQHNPPTTTTPSAPPAQPSPQPSHPLSVTATDDSSPTIKKTLDRAHTALHDGGLGDGGGRGDAGRASSAGLGERPNAVSVVAAARRMGVEEGKGLAVDSGAVGYTAVDVRTGKAMDVALKQLVLAIRKDRQLRGHQTSGT